MAESLEKGLTRSKRKANDIKKLIREALKEDLGSLGDLTTLSTVPEGLIKQAKIFTKEEGVLAGIEVAELVFKEVDPEIKFGPQKSDGERVLRGEIIALVNGPARGILTAERTALNFLSRLSGIATLTAEFVKRVKGTKAKILDTRKTTPGLRELEKYAVRVGGGENHRFGLFDMILIKENHIAVAGGIEKAVLDAKKYLNARGLTSKIEVEAKSLDEVQQALKAGVDRIMLDNMSIDEMKEAVALAQGRVELEASGRITLENVREVAETGVDFISIGALTHSAKALDLSLLL